MTAVSPAVSSRPLRWRARRLAAAMAAERRMARSVHQVPVPEIRQPPPSPARVPRVPNQEEAAVMASVTRAEAARAGRWWRNRSSSGTVPDDRTVAAAAGTGVVSYVETPHQEEDAGE